MVIILVTKKRFVTLYICQILSTMIVYSIILFIRFHFLFWRCSLIDDVTQIMCQDAQLYSVLPNIFFLFFFWGCSIAYCAGSPLLILMVLTDWCHDSKYSLVALTCKYRVVFCYLVFTGSDFNRFIFVPIGVCILSVYWC